MKNSKLSKGMQQMAVRLLERRKFLRFKKNILIGFRKADSIDAYKQSLTEDASQGGFMVEVLYIDQPLAAGQIMELTVKKDENSEPIKALGKIVWFKQKNLSFKTQVGMKLIYINPNDRERMKEFLK